MAGLVLMVALLALVWKKRRSSWSRGEAGAELQEQEQGHLGQELQEMVEDRPSRGENVQGLAGRIDPGGGVEQGRCIGESSLQGRESEGKGLKRVIGEDAALV